MKKPKRRSAASPDAFDDWLSTTKPVVRACMTCSTAGPCLPYIARWVERARGELATPPMTLLHKYLAENHGYALTPAALGKHVRDCLGYSSRAR